MFFLTLSIAFLVKIHWIILECLISILAKLPCVSVESFGKVVLQDPAANCVREFTRTLLSHIGRKNTNSVIE